MHLFAARMTWVQTFWTHRGLTAGHVTKTILFLSSNKAYKHWLLFTFYLTSLPFQSYSRLGLVPNETISGNSYSRLGRTTMTAATASKHWKTDLFEVQVLCITYWETAVKLWHTNRRRDLRSVHNGTYREDDRLQVLAKELWQVTQ